MNVRRLLFLTVVLSATLSLQPGVPAASGPGDWPYWRGPNADGMAVGDAPVKWSDTENVRWKIDIPGRGHSSPVIWGDQIFLTTAIPVGAPPAASPASDQPAGRGRVPGGAGPLVEHKFDVLSIDRRSGKILWQRTAKVATPHEGYHAQYGSFASNSPVTDGKHVYASFGSRGVYCYDLKGTLVWQRDFGIQLKMRMAFGEGLGPVLADDKLILVFDHEGGDSFIAAVDKTTGKDVWRVARDERSNWAAPLVVDVKGTKQVIVAATKAIRAYDLRDGRLIWQCSGLGANTIPHPARLGDLLFVMSGYQNPKLMAIRLGREGDLTGTDAIVWTETRGTSYVPSPVVADGRLYVLTDTGMLSCLDTQTGRPFYQQTRLPATHSFKASPVGANGKLYLASENDDVIVVKMGETFEVLATNTMKDETFIATPAIAGGEIYLRSQKRLYCIASR